MAGELRRQVKGSSRAGVGAGVRAGRLRGWERAPATTPTLNANVSASLAHPAPRSYRQTPGLLEASHERRSESLRIRALAVLESWPAPAPTPPQMS